MFKDTIALKKILALKKRVKIIQGGTSAGKTIAILLILIDIAQTRDNKTISVVSESFPHLRRGAIKDFLDIMAIQNYFKDKNWNKTEFTYTFETGSRIEFFSADQPGKVRGPRRDVLFINEANNISYETYTQLVIRTIDEVYIDYNPVQEFWVHSEIIPKMEHDFVILTYLDNDGLPPSIVQEIESRKGNKNFWRVYGEGELGEAEGRIYTGWAIIKDIPHEARLERYGLDFGYTNDPTVLVAIYRYNNAFIIDEITYQKGMSNKMIVDVLNNLPKALVVADSAEPKSIDEIKAYGISIIGAAKGAGSVYQGIQYVQDQRISLTERSVKTIKAYRNYLFMVDKDGRTTNDPDDTIHEWSNSMDAIRYGLDSFRPRVIHKPQTDFGGVKSYIEGTII